jgi:outer membrane protein W
MKIQIAVLLVTSLIAFSAPAFAQQGAPESEKLKFHKWDIGGSLGLLAASRSATGGFASSSCSCDTLTWAGNFDFGRYFTQHLKAEAGILWTSTRHFYESTNSYPQTFPITYTMREVNLRSVSASFTYQFFENVFAHPYVSAGIRVTLFSEQTRTTVYNPNFSAPPSSTTSSRKFTEAKPFVAAGYKSYFNERVYMRPEALLALDENGAYHGTVRLGFGIDF